jgi:hypothetical protein
MKKISLLLITLLFSVSSLAELKGEMKAYRINVVDEKETRFVATDVENGDIIEYEIIYFNDSEEKLTNVSIKGNIHKSTDLMKGTETKVPEPLYSLDFGTTWSKNPRIRSIEEDKIVSKSAPIEAYNAIKWDVKVFLPNDKMIFTYRVKVKEN